MNDIRILFTDLDGTLLADDHKTVRRRTRDALRALQSRGVKLCACTGRVFCTFPPAFDELNFDYAITCNGGCCLDLRTGERVFTAYMPEATARTVWRYLEPTGCFTEWFVDGEILMNRHDYDQWQERLKPVWHREYLGAGRGTVLDDIHEYFDRGAPRLEKVTVFDMPADMRERAIEPLLATGEVEIASSLGINFEISHITADKGRALVTLAERLNIPVSATLAFGDGSNDIKLLDAAGIGIAMGNASKLVKSHADGVTSSNEADGVAQWLEENLLK